MAKEVIPSLPTQPTPTTQLRGTQNFIWSTGDIMGQGATGAVFKGRHKRTGELVAIKTFNMISTVRPLFKREYEVLRTLNHQNIVRLIAMETESQNGTEVLIMELCTHGSLYHQLDQAENAHGLSEEEFKLLLQHVAAGMQHLRDKGVVHRDIKPGNIMKYEQHESGRFIYKLIDFGAARVLDDGSEFVSLYGTEEYLHPDLYQRAVLRRPMSKRQFGVGVDLWSLGVTLYHAATGHLPFRPYGGRKNREVMYEITTKKPSGHISGIQETEGGPIHWKSDLPETTRLSRGFHLLLVPLLAGLMECDTERMYTFEDFFRSVDAIAHRLCLHVFHVSMATQMHVYLTKTDKLVDFQELIKEQTHILPEHQELLYGGKALSPAWVEANTPGSEYPDTTPQNPIIVYCHHSRLQEPHATRLVDKELPPYPEIHVRLEIEADVALAKTCAGNVELAKRYIEETLLTQKLIISSAIMYSMNLEEEVREYRKLGDEIFRHTEQTAKDIEYLRNSNASCRRILVSTHEAIQDAAQELVSTGLEDSISRLDILTTSLPQSIQPIVNMQASAQRQLQSFLPNRIRAQDLMKWKKERGCSHPEECVNKVDYMCRVTKYTVDAFRRDRNIKSLSYNEEQIHKFEKSKLAVNGTTAYSIYQGHCFPNTKQLFHKFKLWFRDVSAIREQFNNIKRSIDTVVGHQQAISSDLQQSQQQHKDLLAAALSRLQRSATPLSPRDSTLSAPPPAVAPDMPQVKQLMSLMDSMVVEESGNFSNVPKRNYGREGGEPATPVTDLRGILHKFREAQEESRKLQSFIFENGQELKVLEDLHLREGGGGEAVT